MRISVLWSALSSYSVAFFRALAYETDSKLQVIYQPASRDAPYAGFDMDFCAEVLEDSPQIRRNIFDIVGGYDPDCVLMSSWRFPHFMRVCRKLRRNGTYVVSAMDNQWYGTVKQWLGVISAPLFLKPSIDTFLVAGDRQAWFANKLGFDNVLYGLYAGETERFLNARNMKTRARQFLFVGRLVDVKGIDLMRDAYRLYRQLVNDPWELKVVGAGPLQNLLEGEPGVDLINFVQPEILPSLMENSACFVLSSRWEPWGVVIHEAAAAGLPIIATNSCGAVTMFVRDGVNGYVTPPKAEELAYSMLSICRKSSEELENMRTKSIALATLWDPKILAKYFTESVMQRIEFANFSNHSVVTYEK